MPVAAVWGANGFIGNHLVSVLLANQWQVNALTRSHKDIAPHALLSHHRLDLNDPVEKMGQVLLGVDTAFHCAGKSSPDTHPDEFINGTRNYSLACKAAKVKRVILLSTLAINRLSQTGSSSPLTLSERLYAQGRLAAETGALAATHDSHTKLIITRVPMVIGPNMPGRALEILFRSVKNGLFLHPGSESSLLNCVGVNRLAHILFALVDDPLSDHKNTFQFNDCILWKDIVSEFAVALGKPITRVRIPLFLARLAVLMTHNKIEAEKLTALANQTCFEDDTPLLLNNKMDLPETLDDLCNYIKTLLA